MMKKKKTYVQINPLIHVYKFVYKGLIKERLDFKVFKSLTYTIQENYRYNPKLWATLSAHHTSPKI